MRHQAWRWSALLGLLALAACGGPFFSGTAASTPTPPSAFTPTAAPTARPTPAPTAGFVYYTSHDHTYQIAYPKGWTILGSTTPIQFTGPGQLFEVSELGSKPGSTPRQLVNAYCQARQAGVAPNPVHTGTVKLAGQIWTRANCDAGAQSPAIELVVEVVIYQGAAYQIAYTSPIVEFARDNRRYYAPMERSFQFLR